jgi:hypothetical protein
MYFFAINVSSTVLGRSEETLSKRGSYPSKTEFHLNKKFWEELIAYFPWFDTERPTIVIAWVVIAGVMFLPSRCLAIVGEILPSLCLASTGGIHVQTHRLMVRIYEVRRWDALKCHDIYTEFHKDSFRYSTVNRQGYTDSIVIPCAYFNFFLFSK